MYRFDSIARFDSDYLIYTYMIDLVFNDVY